VSVAVLPLAETEALMALPPWGVTVKLALVTVAGSTSLLNVTEMVLPTAMLPAPFDGVVETTVGRAEAGVAPTPPPDEALLDAFLECPPPPLPQAVSSTASPTRAMNDPRRTRVPIRAMALFLFLCGKISHNHLSERYPIRLCGAT
jgi:hypothetical protein